MNIMQVSRSFPDHAACIRYLETVRWRGIPTCPHCESESVARKRENKLVGRWNCYDCKSSFNVLSGTVFQNTKIDLTKWFLAIDLIANAKKSLSSHQLARDLDMNVKTAWYLMQRIREEMQRQDSCNLLKGIIEADETFVGGKPSSQFKNKRKGKRGRGTKKMTFLGAIARGGKVVVELLDKIHQPRSESLGKAVVRFIRENVISGESRLITDGFKAYEALSADMPHHVVTDKREVVQGVQVHTNQMEGFWAGIKRAFYGTHHHYTRKYAPLYIAEAVFKFNRRGLDLFNEFLCQCLPIRV